VLIFCRPHSILLIIIFTKFFPFFKTTTILPSCCLQISENSPRNNYYWHKMCAKLKYGVKVYEFGGILASDILRYTNSNSHNTITNFYKLFNFSLFHENPDRYWHTIRNIEVSIIVNSNCRNTLLVLFQYSWEAHNAEITIKVAHHDRVINNM
jgi:hypothetical protein